MDADEGDPLENLIRELQVFKATVEAMEAPLARRIRTGRHDDVRHDVAHELGVESEDVEFLDDPSEPETPLLRRLRTGV